IMIMDEPTAALTESETATLFEIIGDLKRQGTGIIYISHRLEELKGVADRITVMRDGEYIDTLETGGARLRKIISLMVGREIEGVERPEPARTANEAVLEVRGLYTKGVLEDITFDLRKGEILGFAGLMGAGRTEVARAICGADPI